MTAPMRVLALALALLLVAGCATTPSAPSGTGTVVSIRETQETSTGASIVGAVGGALIGGLIGSQFGGGSGQTIATAVGSIGGSMAGSAVANHAGAEPVWDIVVRFDDGIERVVRVRDRPTVRPGDKVSVSNGTVTRL